jgi:FAD/FMN-containing dehydrogenase
VCDGGLMIDLSLMKAIRVDPAAATARAAGGVLWADLDRATQPFGLATTGGIISHTGIAGLTLGGGLGHLMRKHGLTVDNLLSVDLVTADGRLVTASERECPELFWGVRGGGGNFGIVTELEYRLHEVGPLVTGGMAFYPAERVREVVLAYAGLMASAPDALCALCNVLLLPPVPFVPAPLVGAAVAAIAVCHTGSPEAARRDLAPLRALGPPLIDRIAAMPYLRLQRMYDAAGQFGHHVHGRSGHLAALTDGVVDAVEAHAPRVTSPLSVCMVSALGGAVARVGDHETAFSGRGTAFDVAVTAVWSDPAESPRHRRWADDAWAALRPHTRGVYVNELGNEGGARVREAYGLPTYRRLAALKRAYDPDNVFRLNHNIRPDAHREPTGGPHPCPPSPSSPPPRPAPPSPTPASGT